MCKYILNSISNKRRSRSFTGKAEKDPELRNSERERVLGGGMRKGQLQT
jgi:hypothetical protein